MNAQPPDLLPVPVPSSALLPPAVAGTPAQRLVSAFLGSLSGNTLRAYSRDLRQFADWCSAPTVEAAVGQLLAAGHGAANEAALRWRDHLTGRGLSSATVARRLAALKSVVKLGRVLGMIGWQLDVGGPRVQGYRDTKGPPLEAFRRMLELCAGPGAKATRDRAILRTLFSLGLRRKELVGLDYPADVDFAGGCVWVLGKGRRQRERITLPEETAAALRAWLALRGEDEGALFVALDRGHHGHRLTGEAVYKLVRGLGARVGIRTRVHAIRHLAITQALTLSGGDIAATAAFSRHRDVRVIQVYDDARKDRAADIARRLSGGL